MVVVLPLRLKRMDQRRQGGLDTACLSKPVVMGIISHLAASCIVSTLVPATHSGGCGFYNGFGHTVVSFGILTYSPS